MFRRRSALVALVAGLSLVLAACGGGGDDSAESGGGQQAELQLADLSGQTISVVAKWSGDEQKAFEAVLDEFKSRTNATINYRSAGDNLPSVVGASASSFDVAIAPSPGVIAEWVGKGFAKELPAEVVSLIDQNYAADWKELGSVDGKPIGVPFKGANKSTIWYNQQVLQDAGVDPASIKTSDDLLNAIQTVTDSGTPAWSLPAGSFWVATDLFENIYLRLAGPEKYDQLFSGELDWSDDSVRQTLELMGKFVENGDFIAGGHRGALNLQFEAAPAQVAEGKAAFLPEGDFVAPLLASAGMQPGQFGFITFPSINGSQPAVVGGGDYAVGFNDKPGTKELLKFLASKEAADIAAKGGFATPNKNVDLNNYSDQVLRQSTQDLVNAQTFRFDGSDLLPASCGGEGGFMGKALQDFIQSGGKDIDAAISELSKCKSGS